MSTRLDPQPSDAQQADLAEGPELAAPELALADPDFDALVDYLRAERNFDFGGYKRAGLARRVLKRMRQVEVDGYAAYREYLEHHPQEFAQLFNTILINVTSFFRDEQPWEYLRAEVIPRLLAARAPSDPVRVWCAGCATGEEAYTIAIVLAEALGFEQFRDCVKIYATDLDEEALATARQGTYTDRDVAALPPELVEKYFERDGTRYGFRKDLRRALIFGRNDLMQDAPISRIDLLTCRNTLMYFDGPTQARVLARFHFALVDGGVLVLGKAETLLAQTTLFAPLDLRRRVFVKAPRPGSAALALRERALRERAALGGGGARGAADGARGGDPELQDAAFDASVVAQLVVDRVGRLWGVNDRARALFRLGVPDVGRPLQDLEVSYRPFELRSLIDQAYAEGRTVVRAEVPWRGPEGDLRWVDIVIAPLVGGAGPASGPLPSAAGGVSVSFVEVTRHKQLQQQLQDAQTELEAAYQELQSTNEELETTNEELHSTVEELETTNEELQSTNEELETTNEELQSTNEELQAINDELRQRSQELNRLNDFLGSVFASFASGVAVLDRDLRLLVWNARAEDMWGLRADEVLGAHFLDLDIGLLVNRLVEPVRGALGSGGARAQLTLASINRRGRAIRCRTTVLPLVARSGEGRPQGVIVLMDELPGRDGAAASADGAADGAGDGVATRPDGVRSMAADGAA